MNTSRLHNREIRLERLSPPLGLDKGTIVLLAAGCNKHNIHLLRSVLTLHAIHHSLSTC